MKTEPFGLMPDGRPVEKITLENDRLRCSIITYGAALVTLETPDRDGRFVDIALGYDSLEAYLEQDKCMGAIAGRCANRINNSRFTLGGTEYRLYPNIEPHHLHGGKSGFDKRIWKAKEIPNGALFSLDSPDMDEGYPGALHAEVSYILNGSALEIHYRAESSRDTICNLTNHAYFNINGHDSGDILGNELMLCSSAYTPVLSAECIPTGELAPVSGTPMDFRESTAIGDRIDGDFEQLRFGTGYDHNWVVDGEIGSLRPAATAFGPKTGIVLDVETTSPGVQFYAGNFLDGSPLGKGGAVYKKRYGFCLETQYYPDSANQPAFPPALLRAGETWTHTTVFRLSVRG